MKMFFYNDHVTNFDNAPNHSVVSIATACAILNRSRASIYRHFKSGELSPIKIGHSTRILVGQIRKLIGIDQGVIA